MNMLHPTADDKEKWRRLNNLVPRVLSYPPYGRREPWERGWRLNRPSKRIQIHESRKFLLVVETRMGESFLVETGILGFAIRETAEGIRNPTNDWNPGTLDERRSHPARLSSGPHNPERAISMRSCHGVFTDQFIF